MTAPAYSTNLVDITTAETTSNWAELSGHTSGGAAAQDEGAYIQGSFCVSQATGQASAQNAGLQYTHTSNVGSGWTTGHVFLAWQFFNALNIIDTWSNGGLRFRSAVNMNIENAQSNDKGRLPY